MTCRQKLVFICLVKLLNCKISYDEKTLIHSCYKITRQILESVAIDEKCDYDKHKVRVSKY